MHKQGQQIDAACSNTNKIHNDLSVAETLIYNLDSWLNKWNVETSNDQLVIKSGVFQSSISDHDVVYANLRLKTTAENRFT